MKTCRTCRWAKRVSTLKWGVDPYCLHPRAANLGNGLPETTYTARSAGMACGPEGSLHSDGDARMGHVPITVWQRDH